MSTARRSSALIGGAVSALALILASAPACDDASTTGTGGKGGGAALVCGDGFPDPDLGEECDDGNLDDNDACSNQCKKPKCGDGKTQSTEDCDDGNLDDTDACTSLCKAAACGDGFIQAGVEDCDDGNEEDGDACSSSCKAGSGCGNGVIEMGEECDDGNKSNSDGCISDCFLAYCGDGYAELGAEECDDGNMVDDDTCTNMCKVNQPATYDCPGTPADLAGDMAMSFGGDTGKATDVYSGTCGGAGAPEIVYAFTALASGVLTIDMSAATMDGDPVLYVREGSCESGTEIACADQTFGGGTEEVSFAVTAGTTYYVFADGYSDGMGFSTSGAYTLDTLLLTQVPGDECPGVNVPIQGAGDTYSLTGSTAAAKADRIGLGLCNSSMTPEVIYKVTPPVSGKLIVSVDPTYDASVYIRTTCEVQSSQVVCAEAAGVGGLEVAQANVTAGNSYWVIIDGKNGSKGSFNADFHLQ
ncbi:MAG: DUF4215 domain-containing protein [Polyangiaceae bacterium]